MVLHVQQILAQMERFISHQNSVASKVCYFFIILCKSSLIFISVYFRTHLCNHFDAKIIKKKRFWFCLKNIATELQCSKYIGSSSSLPLFSVVTDYAVMKLSGRLYSI